MKYKIKWYASKTGKSGYGTGTYPRKEAQDLVNRNNTAGKGEGLTYTIERVE